ncbi:MAG: N-6 DNA methylase, partial [Oligoflexia bacterium]|nr:N-6 DNA methylase [Oligoflexia bacterium]
MSIFQKSVIKTYLAGIDKDQLENAYQIFKKNYSSEKIELIKKLKEEEYQDGFLRDIFVDVLGYTLKPDDNFNLVREFKNQSDSKKADGAILKNNTAKAVIELKSTKTKDLKIITEQAFNYKNNQPECKYVITSNFQKLRFYLDYANEYEEFDLFRITKQGITKEAAKDAREEFDLLFLILSKESILNDIPEKLKKESIFHEESVSKKLYADYSVFRKKLFENLTINNPAVDKLTLFSKSQKLIDRFLFILFAEDKGLLPPNSISRIIERFNTLKEEDAYKPLYEIYKQYFGYMNTGRKGQRAIDDIPAYNGGLFYPDEVLYELKIDDDILIDDLQKLSAYDFDTEVDVNILGHIFEHSLSEIEETTAKIKGIDVDKTKSKRKKDGIFYTPQYITQYIVENTIGKLCDEKRKELDISEIEVDESLHTKKGELSKKGNILYQKLEDYKDWLLTLKILDPACGSGAFLNQALSFLIKEHNFIIEIQTDLNKGQVSMFNVEKAVLENNLYGVDINEESIEITKLSLWLRTAHKDRKLSDLSSNIRCGNSLIDDPEIAGDKAFNWGKEFSKVMENGGFDVVIGNPPYGIIFELDIKKYLEISYPTFKRNNDLYIAFIHKSIELSKKGG